MPTNHNGGSSAGSRFLGPGGMLGPLYVRDQSSPVPLVQPDGLRPPLFRGLGGEPLLLLLLRELSGKLAWLFIALKTIVRLLMMRAHLFILRAFVTAEDFRLRATMSIFLHALGELQPHRWASLMQVFTSPKPVLQALDPEVAARGLGDIGTYHISEALWDEVVGEGVDVERLASEFAPEVTPPPAVVHRRETDPLVEPMLRFLEAGVLLKGCWRTRDGPPRAGSSLSQNHKRRHRSFSTGWIPKTPCPAQPVFHCAGGRTWRTASLHGLPVSPFIART